MPKLEIIVPGSLDRILVSPGKRLTLTIDGQTVIDLSVPKFEIDDAGCMTDIPNQFCWLFDMYLHRVFISQD